MPKSRLLLFGLEILALASFFWHQTVSALIGWEKSRLYLHILLFMVSIALCTAGFYKLLHHIGLKLSANMRTEPTTIRRIFVLGLSPLLFLFLVFLQRFFFLKDIRPWLLPVSLGGSAYLVSVLLSQLKRTHPQPFASPNIIHRLNPNQVSSKRLAWFVFGLSLFVYILYASGLIFPAQPFTGDEPHYLLTTESIVKDGDINLFNNYRDKDYSEFYPGELSIHAFPGKKGEKYLYSKHFIGLSALMVPSFALGKAVVRLNTDWSNDPETKREILVFFARLPVCLITALLSLLLFFLFLDVTQRKDVSVLAWAVFSFTSPILFFSHLLYPEIPAALLTIFAFRSIVFKKESRVLFLVLSGAAVGLLPWFGIKYLPLSAALIGVSAFTFFLDRRLGYFWKKTVFFLTPIGVSAGFYLLFFWIIYRNLSPVSVYTGVTQGFELPDYAYKIFIFPFINVLCRSLGYFIDQKFGIIIYTPLYILGFTGIYFYFKKKKRETVLLLAVMASYWIFSANYYWGGYCPPGRPIIPVLWILGLFLAIGLAEKQTRFRKAITAMGITLSLAIVWAALRDPWILYHEQYASEMGGEFLYSKLTRALSNSLLKFYDMLPSLKEMEVFNWLTVLIWMIAICGIVVIFIRKKETKKSRRLSMKISGHLCLVFCVSSLLLAYVFFDIHIDDKVAFAEHNYALYFQDDNQFGKEVGGFWTKGKRRASVIMESPHRLSAIQVTLTSPVGGNTAVQIGPCRKKTKRAKSTGLSKDMTFSSVKGLPMRQGYLYFITIEDSSGFVPYQLDRNVEDNRYLGVFVQLKTVR